MKKDIRLKVKFFFGTISQDRISFLQNLVHRKRVDTNEMHCKICVD